MTAIKKSHLWRRFFYLLIAVNIAVLIGLWWVGSGSLYQSSFNGSLIALGRLAGLLTECAILLQLILVARIPILESSFGFDKMNKLHRVIGYSIAGFFIFHPLLLTIGYAREDGYSILQQFMDFLNNWQDVFKALIGVMIFAVVIFVTVFFRKKIKYETWHGIHLFVYVGIALTFGHQINTADVSQGAPLWRWLALNFTVFGLLLFYRALRPLINLWRHRFKVLEVKQESSDIWSVLIGGRNISRFKFHAGQFAQFFFFQKGFILPHPFSFSAAPGRETLRITIKSSGDFTAGIKDIRPGTRVMIDGPMGRFTAKAARKDKFLLIAGGVGITPIRAMAEELARDRKDAIVLYTARAPQDFALADEIPSSIPVRRFASQEEAEGHEKGRITKEAIQRLSPDFRERSIYICGPDPMMLSLKRMFLELGVTESQIHMERFAL